MALVAALAAMAACAATAAATAGDCGNTGCVMLVEVDGLEPGDVTSTATPFLWALAHPKAANTTDVAGTVADNVFAGRNGFMWQAGRSPMTASTATATASLLTGANPDQHGVLADELLEPDPVTSELTRRRLRAVNDGGSGDEPVSTGTASTLIELVPTSTEASEPEAWAFIGNPALAVMLDDQLNQAAHAWTPTTTSGGDPSLCPLPRSLPGVSGETPQNVQDLGQRDCPARDGTTLQQAFSRLSDNPEGKTPLLTYIHLAELGRVKQLHGDAEAAKTLQTLDVELAAFVEGLANHPETSGAWDRTLLVVTGNHGYEPTPIDRRVPHPEHTTTDESLMWDFSDFVPTLTLDEKGVFVPQGTIGTLYAPDEPPENLPTIAAKIEEKGNEGCQALAQEDCIAEVAPIATLSELHKTWALNPLTEAGEPTGAGGQLVVTTKPGWAFGRAVQRPVDPLADPETVAEATNPYPGSAGGPRNRAIAVLLNGPGQGSGLLHSIKQVEGDYMPVKRSAETAPSCGARSDVSLADANAPDTMADDAAASGHECQPETVDIGLSIAGFLMLDTEGVPVAPHARFLDEAFTPGLGPQEEIDLPQPELPQPEPPPPPPPIVIVRGSVQVITPPPPRDPFPYRGLIRRLRVRVTDAFGKTFAMAKRGARLSTIQVQADFGKPFSRVTLTFYKKRGGRRRARLSAIARFKPFVVRRGPVRLRLRIPSRFRPTHLGLAVQEVAAEDVAAAPRGRPGGGIAQIRDARRLHSRKGASRKPRRSRR